jgi:VanZ family protein
MVIRPPERSLTVLFAGFWLPVVAYLAVIFALSSQPHLKPPLDFAYSDKVMHVGEYLGLGVLLVRALRATLRVSRPLFAAVMAVGFVVLVGSADEFLQAFIPGRTSDIYDLLADSIGGGLAQFVYVTFVRG